MKLVKLSLAALITLGSMAQAADTLADAFKNGKATCKGVDEMIVPNILRLPF